MKEANRIIHDILDRKARYGGNTFLVKIANVSRETQKRLKKRANNQELIRYITEEVKKRGGVHWGHCRNEGNKYSMDTQLKWQIYQIHVEKESS